MPPSAGSSGVWKHFTILENQPDSALCKSCGKSYTCKGGTTSSLWNHLRVSHKEVMKDLEDKVSRKRSAEEPSSKPAKQMKLTDCIPESSESLSKALDEAIVEFIADSGVAFRVAGLKSFEKILKLANKRVKLKDPRTYSRMMKLKAKEIKDDIMAILAAVKGDLNCCGFTTDMWTSLAGIPFMSLTLHFIDKDWVLHRFIFVIFINLSCM